MENDRIRRTDDPRWIVTSTEGNQLL